MALVNFLLLDGATIQINTDIVANLSSVPSSLLPVGVPAGTYVDQPGEVRLAVQGTLAAVSAIIAAGSATPLASDGYAPAFSVVAGAVASPVGTWRALRIGTRVLVMGSVFYTPFAAVPEPLKFSLPPSIPPTPAVFANPSELSGSATSLAPAVTTAPEANVGSSLGVLTINSAGGVLVAVAFGYDAA